jgi:hypothetical protein
MHPISSRNSKRGLVLRQDRKVPARAIDPAAVAIVGY